MININFKDFSKFVTAQSSNKITVAANIKANQDSEYEPHKDYFKFLRKSIQDYENSQIALDALQNMRASLKDPKKRTGYTEPLNGYVTWRGQFPGNGVAVETKFWTHGQVRVKARPTICINDDGVNHHILLHFVKDLVSADRADVICTVMDQAFNRNSDRSHVLNVRPRVLLSSTDSQHKLLRIQSEATYLQNIWDSI